MPYLALVGGREESPADALRMLILAHSVNAKEKAGMVPESSERWPFARLPCGPSSVLHGAHRAAAGA